MLIIDKPESGQRKEVYDVAEKVQELAHILFVDDVPNKEQLPELLATIMSLAREAADGAAIPKEMRVLSGMHAFSTAGALLFDGAITYPDEVEVE